MHASLAILHSADMFPLVLSFKGLIMALYYLLFFSFYSTFVSSYEWSLSNNFWHKNPSIVNSRSFFGMSWQTVAIGAGVLMGINAARHFFLVQPFLKSQREDLSEAFHENERLMNEYQENIAIYIEQLNEANKLYFQTKMTGNLALIDNAWNVYLKCQKTYMKQSLNWDIAKNKNLLLQKTAKQDLAYNDFEVKYSYYAGMISLLSFCGIAAWHLQFQYFKYLHRS